MSSYNLVAQMQDATVVSSYEPEKRIAMSYQSEAELEEEFMQILQSQGYERVSLDSESIVTNLRAQLEKLNDIKFSESEWNKFFKENIANDNSNIEQKSRTIQEDNIKNLIRDDGSTKNIALIDKSNPQRNSLQFMHQYVASKKEGACQDNRYDVTILVNGLPLVQIELKRRGVLLKEAFNQIDRYQAESYDSGAGLFEYVQIFVISNGTHTKYYSNTTRKNASNEYAKNKKRRSKTSNSFEFTCYWTDANNKVIADLVDFAKTFFARHTILNILTKYCIFTSENNLIVMRPYQIIATERIINRIEITNTYKKYGTIEGGGYIWHTTGSGKTLTSFKTARMASKLDFIDKVLFVVDRKDLDYQTMKEYDRFEEGAANSNTSTRVLQKQLEDDSCKIIITTIQKLSNFIKRNKSHEVFNNHIVMIFDECHRSQFGDMHAEIIKNFKKYHIFGFTGTPIFAANTGLAGNVKYQTTELTFGKCLHAYTICDAINDGNVLPFRIDYINTVEMKDNIKDEQVEAIDYEKLYLSHSRIEQVVKYIRNSFDAKTYRNGGTYVLNRLGNISQVVGRARGEVEEIRVAQRVNGFNAMFAVASVNAAKLYYEEFKSQQAELPEGEKLKVATIFSYSANEEMPDGVLYEESPEDTSALDIRSREFLEGAIADYNKQFKTSYDTSSDSFQNYYKDVSLRMKNMEIDMLIVVNMFLTGFDATTLNTLYVDKNLKMHGLIQAFSRTNRILNAVKRFGNIVCFRNLQEEVDKAISLFADKGAKGIVLLRSFDDYYYGYTDDFGEHFDGYVDMIDVLKVSYPLTSPIIVGEENKREFVRLFSAILRQRNILVAFDDFKDMELLEPREFQDYLSIYQDIRDETKTADGAEKVNVEDDVTFEIELIRQVEVNIDYILMLIKKYHDDNCTDAEIMNRIKSAINSSPSLRSKKKLIEEFVRQNKCGDEIVDEWSKFIKKKRIYVLEQIIEEENLKRNEAYVFMQNSFRDGEIKSGGTGIVSLLPPLPLFGGGNRSSVKRRVLARLREFFEVFYGIGGPSKFETADEANEFLDGDVDA